MRLINNNVVFFINNEESLVRGLTMHNLSRAKVIIRHN